MANTKIKEITFLDGLATVTGNTGAPAKLTLDKKTTQTTIWVSKEGLDTNNGTFLSPVLTITQAFTLISSSRNKVLVMPGEYEEVTTLTFPAINCILCGIGGDTWGHGATISEPTDAATTLKINHIVDGSRVIGIRNISIECNEQAAGVYPLHVVKTGTAKLYLTLVDVTTEQHTDYSGVYVDFSGTSDKGNIWWTGGLIGGKITCVFGHADDRLWLKNIRNPDGIFTSGAYAADIVCEYCTLKPAYAVDATDSELVVMLLGCVGFDGNEVAVALTEGTSLNNCAGASVLICPASV